LRRFAAIEFAFPADTRLRCASGFIKLQRDKAAENGRFSSINVWLRPSTNRILKQLIDVVEFSLHRTGNSGSFAEANL